MTLADALTAAQDEMGLASPVEAKPGMPPAEAESSSVREQASTESSEQPAVNTDSFSEEAKAMAKSLLDTTEESQGKSGPGIVPGSDDFWNFKVDVKTVSGTESVSLRELQDGYLRQADYTQKTQSLAEQRNHANKAVEFLDAFNANPQEFARSLALQAGYIQEGDVPIKEIPIAKIPTQEEIDARVQELVDERIKSDPIVQQSQIVTARAEVNQEFDRLEGVFNIPLNEDVRAAILQDAISSESTDLEGLLAKRIVKAQQKQSQAAATSAAGTSRPGALPASATNPDNMQLERPKTLTEAYRQAQVMAAQQ